MRFDGERLEAVFDRTDGKCHICGGRLSFSNYGKIGARGAREVEHSVCRARGGSNHGNNLYAAHVSCNRSKGTFCTRTARAWFGRSKAPLSKARKQKIRSNSRWGGGTLGALTGAAVGGPIGFIGGAVLGALLGDKINPE
jgi:hypothetical protein